MLMKVYSVFDRKMREYGQLVHARTDEAVVRSFSDSLNNGTRSPVSMHAEDYELMCVGEFDPETGELQGLGHAPRFVIAASTLIRLAPDA